MGFSGQKNTWSNNRLINQRIWKRIERGFMNDNLLETIPQTTITDHPSTGSDNCSLLLEITNNQGSHTKDFKFLNYSMDSSNLLGIVKACWDRDVNVNSMWRFHL